MPLMKEAMSKEDFDRSEQGLAPLKKVKIVPPDPEKPVINKEIKLSDIIVLGEFYNVELMFAKRSSIRNEQGVMFIGFEIVIEFMPIESNDGKKPEDFMEPLRLEGWMIEGEFLAFVRTYRNNIRQHVISW